MTPKADAARIDYSTDNMVTLRLTATWFAVLLQELDFGARVAGRGDMAHSPKNCESLFTILSEQGQPRMIVEAVK